MYWMSCVTAIYARGFGNRFHEGIVSLMILQENPRQSSACSVRVLIIANMAG